MSKWLIKFPAWMLVFVLKHAGEGADTSTVLCHDKVVCLCFEEQLTVVV